MPQFPVQDINQFYMMIYGGYGYDACAAYLSAASGIVQGGNPAYAITDFLAMYPKFFGVPVTVTGTFTEDSETVAISSTTGLVIGSLISCQALNSGTVITSVNTGNVGVSAPATASGSFPMTAYVAPIVPLVVIQLYLNIANASLASARWREAWQIAMGLYIAHYCTLYLQTEGNTQTTASQIVANSLQAGITISQGADGVSQGLKDLQALENWGTWSLTGYGVQLATMARVVGAGAVYIRR